MLLQDLGGREERRFDPGRDGQVNDLGNLRRQDAQRPRRIDMTLHAIDALGDGRAADRKQFVVGPGQRQAILVHLAQHLRQPFEIGGRCLAELRHQFAVPLDFRHRRGDSGPFRIPAQIFVGQPAVRHRGTGTQGRGNADGLFDLVSRQHALGLATAALQHFLAGDSDGSRDPDEQALPGRQDLLRVVRRMQGSTVSFECLHIARCRTLDPGYHFRQACSGHRCLPCFHGYAFALGYRAGKTMLN
ncbi:hypothetical protein CBM2586_B30021 [Cupriavidus phytorum]|uniref:Uncharacterized protein n=1 Tax=Cupriavidus taiwanensis TaxID=164546 RepID=A0A375CK91_9BURK|nr:hypothetical protein CBM2586_B30021 [Cupriavidus taiwanensis]